MSIDVAGPEEPTDLAADVARLDAAVTEVTEDVEAMAYGLTKEIDALRAATEALQQAVGQSGAKAKARPPRPWGQRATVEDWRVLVEWVDWLSTTYDTINARRIAPCWPAHSGVVHELAALHSAWLRSAVTPEPDEALAYWHDRLLWPLLMRLDRYRISACTEAHKDVRAPHLTSHDVLQQALIGVPAALEEEDDAAGVDASTGEVL